MPKPRACITFWSNCWHSTTYLHLRLQPLFEGLTRRALGRRVKLCEAIAFHFQRTMPVNLIFLRINRILLLSALFACVQGALASDRLALVIGNSAYRHGDVLDNPRNDADAMAELLGKAGFQVEKQLDGDLAQMNAAVNRFGTAIRDPKVKFGLFYYAGHGLQQDWRNYIVPVSANISIASDIPKQTVDVSNLLRYMEQADTRSFLVILDSCRDNPVGAFQPLAKGLSQFNAPAGSMLAYATAPGSVSQDGAGKNGLYTSYLLREFAVLGAPLEDAFKRVGLSVRMASKGSQVPWITSSLTENIQIFPVRTRELTDTEKDRLLEKEMTTWLRVKSSADPEVLADFIREYPSGSASELAQSRLNRLLAIAVAQENERMRLEALASSKKAQEIADQQEAARRRLAEAEKKRLADLQAEQERVQLAQAAAAREEALRQEALKEASRLAEVARVAAAAVHVAEQAARLAVAAELEAVKLGAQRIEAARLAEAARQSRLQAQAAEKEAQRIQAAQLQKAQEERVRLAQVEQVRLEQLRLAELEKREADRLAQEQKAFAVSVAGPSVPAPVSVPPTPFFAGYSEHHRNYSLGDQINIRVIDQFSKASKPLVMTVTQVDLAAERVLYNDGEFASDLMGNTTTNQLGSFSTPRQFYPAELIVGKKWHTRFKQSRPGGVTFTFQYDLKVIAKERITVPAGTFEAYKIEARGFNVELGASLERNIWVAPGVNADIAHEIRVRLRNGKWDQNDRQELVSFLQAKQ